MAAGATAFSGETDAGSRQENASKEKRAFSGEADAGSHQENAAELKTTARFSIDRNAVRSVSRGRMRRGFAQFAGLLCLTVFSLALGAGAVEAESLADAQAAVGQWDLSLAGSNRSCRINLRSEIAGAGYVLSMPAGCRRGIPALAHVAIWLVPAVDHLYLTDAAGMGILDFSSAPDGQLVALGSSGETYRLAPVSASGQKLQPTAPAGQMPSALAAALTGPVPGAGEAATPPAVKIARHTMLPARPGEVAGRYYILRDGGKDTGCMLILSDTRGTGAAFRAALAPACRDQGMVIFDPTGWQLVGQRLVLTARKGHTTHLDHQEDGSWAKDSHEGKALVLKKM